MIFLLLVRVEHASKVSPASEYYSQEEGGVQIVVDVTYASHRLDDPDAVNY